MYFLIRQLLKSGGDSLESADSEVVADCLTIGSDQGQHIHVADARVLEQHAVIKQQGKGAKIECLGSGRIKLNGKDVASAVLNFADEIEIGNTKLSIFAAPAGFDLALQIETLEESSRSKMAFSFADKGFPSIRLLSYAIFFLVIVFGLVFPWLQGEGTSLGGLVSQKIWQSGPFHNAHKIAALADNCQACHQVPFQRVQDNACTSCHVDTAPHSTAERAEDDEYKPERCASCHREHNEQHFLFETGATGCIDCHSRLSQPPSTSVALADVKSFSQQEHPLFSLQQMHFDRDEQRWLQTAVNSSSSEVLDQSNLKFDHQMHLNQEKVWDGLTGDALSCQSCHQLSSDNEHFIPITMDTSCRGCHALSIEANGSERILPHGEPKLVAETIEEYFISKLSKPQQQTNQRLLPGVRRQSRSCNGSALECGTRMAAEMIDAQFSQSGCITCHIVEQTGSSDPKEKWRVLPVKLINDWYASAKFKHKPHLSLQQFSKDNRDLPCLECHDAKKSTSSVDVLIPDQKNCLQCHDSKKSNSVRMECSNCHLYHSQTPSASFSLEP